MSDQIADTRQTHLAHIDLIFAADLIDAQFAESLYKAAVVQTQSLRLSGAAEPASLDLRLCIFESKINMPGAVDQQITDLSADPERCKRPVDSVSDKGVDLTYAPDLYIHGNALKILLEVQDAAVGCDIA